MHHHFVADLDVGHVLADLVDDTGRIAAADMEVFGFAVLVACGNNIDGNAHGRPNVVVVDARRHHVNQHFVIGD